MTVAAERERSHAQYEADKWAGSATSEIKQRGPRLTEAEAEAVPKDLTRAQLRTRLGAPAATGIQRVFDEPDLRCLAYRRAQGTWTLFAFCFDDGRYTTLRRW